MYKMLYVLYKIIFACIQEETTLQTVFIKIIIIAIKIFIESYTSIYKQKPIELVFISKKNIFFSQINVKLT